MGTEVITFWKQPGGRTMKRDMVHVTTEMAEEEITNLVSAGFTKVDHGHKVVLTK